MSKNTKLGELYCYSNKLWSLDLSSNSAITNLRADQVIPGKSVMVSGGKYTFDLSDLVQDKSEVSVAMDGATYSAATGVITFTSPVDQFSYTYATGADDMCVTVEFRPTITTQPKAKTVTAGAKATFKVVAAGADSYKWQYQKPGSSTWTDVKTNGTSATYSLTTGARHNGYKYRCKVTNASGSVYTSAVKLTVK